MEPSDLIVLTPPNTANAAVAIAASRAGAVGILDLEFRADASATAEAFAKLARFAGGSFGVLLHAADADQLLPLFLTATAKPARVILTGDHSDLARHTSELRSAGIEILLEATTLAEATRAAELGVAGLVLKGHEAAGRVGTDTSFVLIQKWKRYADKAGVKCRSGFAAASARTPRPPASRPARGVVLDSQVLLAKESPLSEARARIAGLDVARRAFCARLGEAFRVYSRPDSAAAQELAKEEERLLVTKLSDGEKRAAWRAAVRKAVAADPAAGAWPIGQDVVNAAGLAAKGVTVAGIVAAICERATKQLASARKLNHLAEGAALAKSHGTKYPILQGPMTRVSDTAAFANAVATGGALPFLALALLRKTETEQLLKETKAKLGAKPWGVGILGFVPNEIRAEQLEAIRAHKPPFAVIAGGRPDQAKALETQGIPTYLHVPSPGLLKMFLKDGAKRFVFEGQECGGHIGPRASFALWESAVEVIAEYVGAKPADDLHVVFAGGVHDALSAQMVAALSASLAEKGVKVGVLIGTAYLFTKEAVDAGAITARFQKEALACGNTVLLETGPGHAIRCIPTPYADAFEAEKRKLQAEGKSPLEVGISLERMNLGRLRVASKGVDRTPGGTNGTGLSAVPDDDQFRRGMYMIGQVAALRDSVTTIAQLHADVCARLPDSTPVAQPAAGGEPAAPPPATSPSSGCRASTPVRSGCGSIGRTSSRRPTRSSRSRRRTGTGARTTTPTPAPATRWCRSGAGSCRT